LFLQFLPARNQLMFSLNSERQKGPFVEMKQHIAAFLIGYLMFLNLAAAAWFWHDKRKSVSGGWRTPENTLLGLAFWGGSVGALAAQQILRHKTRKQPFRSRLIMIAVFQLLCLTLWAMPQSHAATAGRVSHPVIGAVAEIHSNY
jgi:uncharacterized membrane protein YsdA (DUF1294 family)